MTPERIKEIASSHDINVYDFDTFPNIERAIRQAVNEAYYRAAIRGRITQIEGGLVDDAIRAMKLPEE